MAKENKCPFCGGKAREKCHASNFMNPRNIWYYQCETCGATGPAAWHPKEAKEKWERRADNGTE